MTDKNYKIVKHRPAGYNTVTFDIYKRKKIFWIFYGWEWQKRENSWDRAQQWVWENEAMSEPITEEFYL